LVGISHDITRRKQAEEELQRRTNEMEADVFMARQVQETFIPRTYPVFPEGVPPEASALRFAHRYLPATTLGGDFFDITRLSDSKCGILVCDVMGHGVRAGLLTALIRGVVGELGERAENPEHVLAEINHSLAPILERTGQPVFASAFYGVIDCARATLIYGNAGHPGPFIRRGDSSQVTHLAPPNPEPAAGLIAEFTYTRQECTFNPGDLLLGYTDGVIEAPDASGQFYGDARLTSLLRASADQSAEEICERLVQDLSRYSGRTSFDDDVCVVAVESTGISCAVPILAYEI
jgi:sigma-B regulation protein RsbU (phosphoserine phosphatase)